MPHSKLGIPPPPPPEPALSMPDGKPMAFRDGDGRTIALREIIDHVQGPVDTLGVMEKSMSESGEYKVIEPLYAEEQGDPIEQLQTELNDLARDGWSVVAASSVRGARRQGDRAVVGALVPVIILGRERKPE